MKTTIPQTIAFLLSTSGVFFFSNAGYARTVDLRVDQNQKIKGGDEVEACGFASVNVTMVDDNQGGSTNNCSATLVHPELIVLAAHCIHQTEGAKVQSLVFGEDAEAAARELEVVACIPHPEYRGGGEGVDLAFCVLKEAQRDIPLTPVAQGCELDDFAVDTEATIVGFGATRAISRGAAPPYLEGSGIKRFTKQKVVEISDKVFVQGDSDNSACFGDSGGPLFHHLEDGQVRLIGVASHVHLDESWDPETEPERYCGQGAYYQPVAPYVAWIEELTRRDISPCFDAEGNWDPNELCKDLAVTPETVAGSWDESVEGFVCSDGQLSGWVSTCGEPYQDSDESTGGGEMSGTESGDGEGGTGEQSDDDDSDGSETSSDGATDSDTEMSSSDSSSKKKSKGCSLAVNSPDQKPELLVGSVFVLLLGWRLRRR